MKKQKKKLKTRSDPQKLTYRTLSLRQEIPETIDDENRSVEAVGASEEPVEVFDWERYAIIPEILLMSGCQIPASRQVPLLDTHMRHESNSVLGSYRDMKADGPELTGRAVFSSAAEAEGPWTRVKEGHLTDFSVGYRIIESTWIPENENQTINGKRYDGPLRVVTKWKPREMSVCPIGADQRAKARSFITIEKERVMDEMRKLLVEFGMPADATDEEMRAFKDEIKARAEKKTDPPKEPKTEPVNIDHVRAEAQRIERERIAEITATCRAIEGFPEDMVRQLITEGKSIDETRKVAMGWLLKQKKDVDVPDHSKRHDVIMDEKDKFREAAEGAVLIRSGIPGEHGKIQGASDLAGYSLVELARHSLLLSNQSRKGSSLEVVGRALTTSDFPYILANVAHKSLFQGWETANETWREWCATGSVSDFKTHYSPRVGEFSDLEEIAEMEEYKHGKRTEAQETYSIATYGKMAGISRQAIINDDLNAITSNFMGMGEAAARKIGDLPYAVLTANAAMGDSNSLFDATNHRNLVAGGSGAPPGVATLDAAFLAMGTQKDLQGLRRLNIRPQYLLAPMALMGATEVFFKSEKYVDESSIGTPDEAVATTRANQYAGAVLQRIYESRLDDDDPAAWYLAAAKGKTVTVFFLNGNQTPYMEQQQGWNVDGTEFKVRIDAGAKAMGWRGLYCNDGN
jgi:hypothetical protein